MKIEFRLTKPTEENNTRPDRKQFTMDVNNERIQTTHVLSTDTGKLLAVLELKKLIEKWEKNSKDQELEISFKVEND